MYKKKISVQQKIKWKKIHAVTLKKFDQSSKKNSYKENDKKIHMFENSPPPITSHMVRPLEQVFPTTLVCNNFHTLKLKA